MVVNYYDELQLNPDLSEDELKKSLYELERKWLGRQNAPNVNRRHEAEKKLLLIADAKKTLLV